MSASSFRPSDDLPAIPLHEIETALRGLRFGAVEITVHNGQVVQIERKEKFRPALPSANKA